MTWFFHSIAFPGCLAGVGLILSLASGRVMDCRRSSRQLWLRRQDSPFYYWFFVIVLAGITGMSAWLAIAGK
jgi:hypothetical protein